MIGSQPTGYVFGPEVNAGPCAQHHHGSLEALDVLSVQAGLAQVVERCPVDLKRYDFRR